MASKGVKPMNPSDSACMARTLVVHAASHVSPASVQRVSATFLLVHIRLCSLTFVRYSMFSNLVLPYIQIFAFMRFIIEICSLFVVFNTALWRYEFSFLSLVAY